MARGIRAFPAILAGTVCSIIGSLGLAFALSTFTPGDVFSELELDPSISPAAIASMRARYLPGQSVFSRLLHWSAAALRGDFGYSLTFHQTVTRLLGQRLWASVELIAGAFVLAWIIAVSAALLMASTGDSKPARAARMCGAALASSIAALPVAAVAVAALLLAPVGWLNPLQSNSAIDRFPWLAASVLAIGFIPPIYFQTLNALASVLHRPFILAARARGNGPARLLLRHALPNTLDLLIPLAAVTATQLLLETVIVETLFAWPGIGQLSMAAAARRDMPLLSALVLLTCILVVAANFASDVLQWWSNPKLRYEG